MKKILVALVMVAMMAAPAMAVVSGTSHDLSSTGPQAAATGTTQICVFCHTPHGGVSDFPLWNRTNVTATGAYSSTTLNASIGGVPGEAGACLSCHDGVSLTNTATIVNAPNAAGASFDVTALSLSTDANLGTDMSNDHPVGFLYNDALATADGGLVNATALPATVPLFSGEMWCSTCHDVHGTAFSQFLVIDNAASALCTTCHIK